MDDDDLKDLLDDDDIRKYLKGSYNNLELDNRPILIKDILTHTTGIKRENFSLILSKMFSIDATEYFNISFNDNLLALI